jgi:hypothetical protein
MSLGRRFRVAIPAAMVLTTLAMAPTQSLAGSAGPNPARVSGPAVTNRGDAPAEGTITAVVVKSWGNCSSGSLIWDALNANWSNYGSIPISIDYSYPGLCSAYDTVTLSNLEASGADVVIVSDPSGIGAQWSSSEAQALRQYANEGHDVIGTYLLLYWGGTDNRVLAPLFGLNSSATYGGGDTEITPNYTERYPSLPLFRNVGNPYVSSGYPFTQTPSDGAWSSNELTGARVVARAAAGQAAILVRRMGAYDSIYVTNMPEFGGGSIDEQFFYNAIIFPATG